MTGCALYFICDADQTAVKIGITRNDPARRLRDLQAGSPVKLYLFHVEFDVEPRKEIDLHQHFAAHWRHREWFDFAAPIRDLIGRLANGDLEALADIPPAPLPKGYRCEDGWLISREDTLRYLRDGIAVKP